MQNGETIKMDTWFDNFLIIKFKLFNLFCTDAKDISFDHKKYRAKVPIRKREAQESIVERRSTLTIR